MLKTEFLILLTIFWSVSAICQDTKSIVKKFSSTKQVSETYSVLKSDKQTKHGEYISYFQATKTENKAIKKDNLKLDDFIKQKGHYTHGQKAGEWIEYSSPYILKTSGHYTQGKKVGIWLTSKEQGQVIERFDFDKHKKLQPFIKINVHYPRSARETEVQGTVMVSFLTHEDCSITDIKVTKSLSPDCDKSAIESIHKYGGLYKRYGVDCIEKIETQVIHFKLENEKIED